MTTELELVQNNGADPLAQAKALIAEEQQARVDRVLKALQENNVEVCVVVQAGNELRLLNNVAGLPVVGHLVAK